MVHNLYTVHVAFSMGMVQGWYNSTMMVQERYSNGTDFVHCTVRI